MNTQTQAQTLINIPQILSKFNLGCQQHNFYHLLIITDAEGKEAGVINMETGGVIHIGFKVSAETIKQLKKELSSLKKFPFSKWLICNYDYSGKVNSLDNAWLSKSATDYNIYLESELKKEYYSLIAQKG